MKRIYLFILISICFSGYTQVSISGFPEDFGPDIITQPGLPTGWVDNPAIGELVVDDVNVPGSNSGGNVLLGTNSNNVTQVLKFSSASTIGYSNIFVNWWQYVSTSGPSITVEWSNDNSIWNDISITPSVFDGWEAPSVGPLPVSAEGQATFFLRFTYSASGTGEIIAIDDVDIQGDPTPVYVWNGTGPLHLTSSWELNGAGGPNPSGFNINNATFQMVDQSFSVSSATLNANWTITGTNTVLYIGDNNFTSNNINFDVAAGKSFALGSTAKIAVTPGSSLTLHSTTFPSAGNNYSFAPNSTAIYAQSVAVNVAPATYYDLEIAGTGSGTNNAISHSSGNITVSNNLTLTSDLLMNSAISGSSLVLNGTISGSGLLLTRANSKLAIGGSGALGTLNFGNGGLDNTLQSFSINRSSSGNVTLGTDLTISVLGSTLTGGAMTFRNGNLDLNGKKLTLNNAVTTNSGTIGGSQSSSLTIGSSTTNITGSIMFDQTTPGTTNAMDEIFMDRSGKTLTLGNPVEIWGNITPSVGTIAAGSGNLTIKSDASHKARIGPISGTGFFTGNPTVEVFRPALNTDWINLCTGGVTGNTFSSWDAVFPMTCSTCPSGTGSTGIPASVYTYDETLAAGNSANSAAYIDIDSFGGYSSTIDSKKGYYVFVGTSAPGTVGSALTIPLTGAVNTKNSSGNITITKTGSDPVEDGWNLISNPYPSALTASAVIATMGANINAASLQSYDPATGGYVMYSGSATIPMGQAFFVQSVVGSAAITPSETWKVTTNDNTAISKMASNSSFYFDDFLLNLTSNIVPTPFFTQAYFTFGNGYTTNYESGDCLSFEGTYTTTPRIAAYLNNKTLVRTAYPSLNGLTTIPVIVKTGFAGVYSISPVNLNKLPAGACVTLFDIANNVSHNLRTGPYSVSISANATTPQFELRITLVPTALTSNFTNPQCKKVGNGILVAKGTTAGPWNYTWKDASNNTIIVHNNVASFDTLKNVAEGTYFVDVNTVGSCDNANTQFVLNATTPLPTALFTANTNTVSVTSNVPVSFTNNSANATNYLWSFGDGATATTANASHAYSNAGVFDVQLIATNGVCADSSIAHSQITALAGPAVGINKNTLASNNAFVSKDDDGIFVQLNFDLFTKTEITVTNILGQVITSKKIVVADKTKYYLNVPENEKIIFVTVEANNQKQTTKIIN
ncbi:MAG: PKD domain-containing protein [Bacteroidota bacterium]|nr:PKD domain-containing protein [Bacteroidota bacterium]